MARLGRFYSMRPSDMISGLSEYDAFCVDEVLAHRLAALEQAETEQQPAPDPSRASLHMKGAF